MPRLLALVQFSVGASTQNALPLSASIFQHLSMCRFAVIVVQLSWELHHIAMGGPLHDSTNEEHLLARGNRCQHVVVQQHVCRFNAAYLKQYSLIVAESLWQNPCTCCRKELCLVSRQEYIFSSLPLGCLVLDSTAVRWDA